MFRTRATGEELPSHSQIDDRPRTAEGTRIYAIGDMHGMVNLAKKMFEKIDHDLANWDGEAIVVGLGDYIDRGPRSDAVLEYLLRRTRSEKSRLITLRGNHEDVMLRFLDEPQTYGADWLQLGGAATLLAYGVALPQGKHNFVSLRNELVERMPVAHLAFLQALPLTFEHARLFFSHAGARPGVSLLNQDERDLLWTRWRTKAAKVEFEKILIHGHTPVLEAVAERGRINVDTGAYATGRLSAVRITPAGINFLSVTQEDIEHKSGTALNMVDRNGRN